MTLYIHALGHFHPENEITNRFLESLDIAGEMYDSFGPMIEKHDAFICPTTALPSVPADHDSTRDVVLVNGVEVDPLLGWAMTYPFNILSRCPREWRTRWWATPFKSRANPSCGCSCPCCF